MIRDNRSCLIYGILPKWVIVYIDYDNIVIRNSTSHMGKVALTHKSQIILADPRNIKTKRSFSLLDPKSLDKAVRYIKSLIHKTKSLANK